jgi:fatty-acyl-CoA synthase
MTTIPSVVFDLVQKHPEKPLFHFRDPEATNLDVTLSSGELWSRACAVAERLQDYPRQAEFMLVLPLGAPLLISHLAVLLHGGVASIFTHPSEKVRPEIFAQNLRNATSILRPRVILASRAFLDYLKDLDQSESDILLWEDFTGSASFDPNGWRQLSNQSFAVAQYSSGSTGLQKCVKLTHEMVLTQCQSYGQFIGVNSQTDRICSWLPLYHDMGLFTSLLLPVTSGVPASLMDPFKWVRNPISLLTLIDEVRGTLCWQPNFAFRLLEQRCSAEEKSKLDLTSLRGLTNCSEPVSAGVMSGFLDAFRESGLSRDSLWVCYAMAENAFAVTAAGGPRESYRSIRVDRDKLARNVAQPSAEGVEIASCGMPIDGCEVEIVDAERMVTAAATVGEIRLRSPFLMKGYVHGENFSQSALDDNGWYYSGDLGFQLDGRLYVTGRKKDLIIVAGRNFYPQDLEGVASETEGAIAGRSVAIGVDDEQQGTQRVVMLVESNLTAPTEISALAANIRTTLLRRLDCAVSEIHVVPHMWLLKTSSGKIARQPNLERYIKTIKNKSEGAASWWEPLLWGAGAAISLYFYTLLFLLGDSKSWNVYAGF